MDYICYFLAPLFLQYVGHSNNFRALMNGHKSDFRLYATGKINKMDNKLLYGHKNLQLHRLLSCVHSGHDSCTQQ